MDESHHYYIRMKVDYTIDSVPDRYDYFLQSEYIDTENGLHFSSDGDDNSVVIDRASLGETCSQVFLNFEYKLVDNVEYLNYSNTYTSDIPVYFDFYLNTTKLSTVDETKTYIVVDPGTDIDTDDDTIVVNEKYGLTISFIGYNNIDEYEEEISQSFLSTIEDFFDDFSKGEDTTETLERADQVILTPNTGKMKSSTLLLIGFTILSLGSTMVYIVIKRGIQS